MCRAGKRPEITVTRAITYGNRRFAFQDGRQAIFDSIALIHGYVTWSHVSAIKQNQYGSQ